jgi:hypothetical protein
VARRQHAHILESAEADEMIDRAAHACACRAARRRESRSAPAPRGRSPDAGNLNTNIGDVLAERNVRTSRGPKISAAMRTSSVHQNAVPLADFERVGAVFVLRQHHDSDSLSSNSSRMI